MTPDGAATFHECVPPADAQRGQEWACPVCGQIWLRVDSDEPDRLTDWRRDE